MPTIASLSKKLDMTAEEAVDILRKLRYDIAGVETEIDDREMDLLIEVDEDRSALERMMEKLCKEDEAKAKKAATAAKKAATAAKKAATAAKKKPVKKAEILEADVITAPPFETEDVKQNVEEFNEEHPPAEVSPEIPQPEETVPAVIEDASVPEKEADVQPHHIEAEKSRHKAEILPDEPVSHVDTPVAGSILVDEDGSEITLESSEAIPAEPPVLEPSEPLGALAEAERLHEEAERRKATASATRRRDREKDKEKPKEIKPLPTPDPEVVRRVIEAEKARKEQRTRQEQRTVAPSSSAPRYKAPTTIEVGAEGAERVHSRPGLPSKSGAGKTANQKQKRAERARVLEDSIRKEAAAAVKEYQSGTAAGGIKKKRRKRRDEDDGMTHERKASGVIQVEENITVERLANMMDMPISELILELMESNILATKNQTLDLELVRQVADRHDFDVEISIPEEEQIFTEEPDNPEDIVSRPPVVTVMGHVDHGKTTLLDKVRATNVAGGEAGGITQHIAAYQVELAMGSVTFLDTPGHEAFTQMRARGAHITDVVVLVVGANDGVKPQTVEAIDHAKAAEVPIVVAINKCDLPNAQPDRVRQELTQYGLLSEEWGGKTVMKNISAKIGDGVDDLMELLALQAEMLDLKANPKKRARGAVIESEITLGQGPVAWVLVQNGTLRVGDAFLAGTSFGRVRTMLNSKGVEIKEAGPSMPVVVTGFSAPPDAGDVFVVTQDERIARSISEKRAAAARVKKGPAAKHMTLEDFHARVLSSEQKTLQIIIKADVQGSVDVLLSSFAKLGNEEVKVSVVHSGVGAVNESDVLLASASDAVIIGFHVVPNTKARKLAEQEGVEIRSYKIIYEALDEVNKALEGLLTPESKETITGHIEVRRVFRSSAVGNIAGCMVQDGEAQRGALARLIRDGVVVYDGKIESLRREKDDARTVASGFECGVKLERYDDIQPGDVIEMYKIDQVAKVLN